VPASEVINEDPERRPLSPAQRRTVVTALELFARNGVGGTSLQMIADDLGVTKAAVYHQFRTKDEIALAAAESELARLLPLLDAAEAEPSAKRAREVLLAGMVDLAVDGRLTVGSILRDPLIVGFFTEHEGLREIMARMRRILSPAGGPEARVRPALLVAAISGAVLHPFMNDIDDRVLREELLRMGRRYLGMPP
jgi:AcrR family transcriptional regulator